MAHGQDANREADTRGGRVTYVVAEACGRQHGSEKLAPHLFLVHSGRAADLLGKAKRPTMRARCSASSSSNAATCAPIAAAIVAFVVPGCDWMYLPPEHPTLAKPVVEETPQPLDLTAQVRDS
jgi:hypothetical protein